MKIWIFEQMHDQYYGQYSWEAFKDKPSYLLDLKPLVTEWNKQFYFRNEESQKKHMENYYRLLLGVMDTQEWIQEFETVDSPLFRLYEKELL